MYRAILLDLGKVLIDFDFSAGYRALEKLCPYPAAEIRRRIGPLTWLRVSRPG
jgi:FMN phosphatase YigB (HAD superfamily)